MKLNSSLVFFLFITLTISPLPSPIPKVFKKLTAIGSIAEGDFVEEWKGHFLSQGESKIIFRAADKNKNGRISNKEWSDFFGLFLNPFNKYCNIDGTLSFSKRYLIIPAGMPRCLDSPEFRAIKDTGEDMDTLARNLFYLLGKPPGKNMGINFADYFFLRRVNAAVKKCMIDGKIYANKISCAMYIISPGRQLDNYDADDFFNLQALFDNKKYYGRKYLDLVGLIGTGSLFYYFNEFELPAPDGTIFVDDFIIALDNQILPFEFRHDYIKELKDYLDPQTYKALDIRAFGFLIFTFRKFYSYALFYKGLFMGEEEFIGMMKQLDFDPLMAFEIDNVEDVKAEMKVQAKDKKFQSGVQVSYGSAKSTEDDYLLDFLQTNSKARSKFRHKNTAKQLLLPKENPNIKSRRIMFTSFGLNSSFSGECERRKSNGLH